MYASSVHVNLDRYRLSLCNMTSDVQHSQKLLAVNVVRHIQYNVDRQIHAPHYSHDQLSNQQ